MKEMINFEKSMIKFSCGLRKVKGAMLVAATSFVKSTKKNKYLVNYVNSKAGISIWVGDEVVFARSRKTCISVVYEIKTRWTIKGRILMAKVVAGKEVCWEPCSKLDIINQTRQA